MVSKHLRNEFIQHITQTNWPKIRYLPRTFDLRNESKESVVKVRKEITRI